MKLLHNLSCILTLATLAITASASLAAEPLLPVSNGTTVEGLSCEYFVDPLGIDVVQPRLGWILQSAQRGQRQTAYQVLVASTPEKLANDQGDLWDSGKVNSDRSTQIEYSGQRLASHQRAYWKVKVWDAKGQLAVPYAPATWSMGFSNQTEWNAKWIGRVKAGVRGPEMGKRSFCPQPI